MGPVDPSFRALAGCLEVTVRRHKFNQKISWMETSRLEASMRVRGALREPPPTNCQGSGFRVQGSGSRVQGLGSRDQGPGSRVQGSGFRVQGSGSRGQDSGSRVQASGFRVQGKAKNSSEEAVEGSSRTSFSYAKKSQKSTPS